MFVKIPWETQVLNTLFHGFSKPQEIIWKFIVAVNFEILMPGVLEYYTCTNMSETGQ